MTTPSAEPQPRPQIAFDEFARVDLRVAKVLSAQPHPDADRLLVLQVDDGSGTPRQICAGIRAFYSPEELVGKSIVIVANLAPRTIRGQVSNGMLLAASEPGADGNKGRLAVLTLDRDLPPGSVVS